VPCGKSSTEIAIIAEWLTAFSAADRARFADAAGCKAPSSLTWSMIVEGARARKAVA